MMVAIGKGFFCEIYPDGRLISVDEIYSFFDQEKKQNRSEIHFYVEQTKTSIEVDVIQLDAVKSAFSPKEMRAILIQAGFLLDSDPLPPKNDIFDMFGKIGCLRARPEKTTKTDQSAKRELSADALVKMAEARKLKRFASMSTVEKQAVCILSDLRIMKKTGFVGLRDAERMAELAGLKITRAMFKAIRDKKNNRKTC